MQAVLPATLAICWPPWFCCSEFRARSDRPPPAVTAPVTALLAEPVTLEPSVPVLLCPLLMPLPDAPQSHDQQAIQAAAHSVALVGQSTNKVF